MAKPTGFLEFERVKAPTRAVSERICDFDEVTLPASATLLRNQSARCMDCGVPFCHAGCPLGNFIPDWNDQVYRKDVRAAWRRLAVTNNFPEFTGRLCPAPCEGACVLGINADAVNIKTVELGIVEHAWAHGWIRPRRSRRRTGKRVAVVGSGPAGLAAADELNHCGHHVTVFERADRIGGLLRYGIPDFKMAKSVLDRRLNLMAQEGVVFRPGTSVGVDVPVQTLRAEHDAVVLATGATSPRDLALPGRTLAGIHLAMDYLTAQNRSLAGDGPIPAELRATGKRVVIIGGGDTGADCLGTAHRQGAAMVYQLEIHPRPPDQRSENNPWPQWPRIFRVSAAHEEGGQRLYHVETLAFVPSAANSQQLAGVRLRYLDTNRTANLDCDMVLLAMGFTGPEFGSVSDALQLRRHASSMVWRDTQWMTNVPGVFATGDMQRGQSLIVWAMADGRNAAASVDAYLMTQRQPEATAAAPVAPH